MVNSALGSLVPKCFGHTALTLLVGTCFNGSDRPTLYQQLLLPDQILLTHPTLTSCHVQYRLPAPSSLHARSGIVRLLPATKHKAGTRSPPSAPANPPETRSHTCTCSRPQGSAAPHQAAPGTPAPQELAPRCLSTGQGSGSAWRM